MPAAQTSLPKLLGEAGGHRPGSGVGDGHVHLLQDTARAGGLVRGIHREGASTNRAGRRFSALSIPSEPQPLPEVAWLPRAFLGGMRRFVKNVRQIVKHTGFQLHRSEMTFCYRLRPEPRSGHGELGAVRVHAQVLFPFGEELATASAPRSSMVSACPGARGARPSDTGTWTAPSRHAQTVVAASIFGRDAPFRQEHAPNRQDWFPAPPIRDDFLLQAPARTTVWGMAAGLSVYVGVQPPFGEELAQQCPTFLHGQRLPGRTNIRGCGSRPSSFEDRGVDPVKHLSRVVLFGVLLQDAGDLVHHDTAAALGRWERRRRRHPIPDRDTAHDEPELAFSVVPSRVIHAGRHPVVCV